MPPIGAGYRSFKLTFGNGYFAAAVSTFSGTIFAGDLLIAHVDSANATTTYGAVNESHELSGGTIYNILSTTAAAFVPDLFLELKWESGSVLLTMRT